MDQIRGYVNTLPVHLKYALDMLISASNEEVKRKLPHSMTSIKNVAEKCLQRAKETQARFLQVIDMIVELQEACEVTKGYHKSELRKAQARLDVREREKRVIEEEMEYLDKQKEQLQESIRKFEEHFSESVTSLPGGSAVLGMAVTEGILNGVSTVLSVVSSPFQKAKKKSENLNQRAKQKLGKTSKNENDRELDEPSRKAYREALVLRNIVNNLELKFVEVDSLNKNEIDNNSEEILACAAEVERVFKKVKDIEACKVQKNVSELCSHAYFICGQLTSISENISAVSESDAKAVASRIIALQDETGRLSAKGQSLMDSCPRQKPPMMKSWQTHNSDSDGAAKRTINNAKLKAEESCRLLKHAQENYAKSSEDLTNASQQLSTILGEMATLDIERLDFKQILEILHRGLAALGDMRVQWGNIVHFFQTITNIIECSLCTSLNNFVDFSRGARKQASGGYSLTHLKRDILYQEVIEISELTGFVSLVAESYSEVSAQHIMPKLSGLHRLLNFDPQKDKSAIQRKQLLLQRECTDAQRQITDLIKIKSVEYKSLADRRIAAIQCEIKSILADQSSAQKQINANVDRFL